MRLLLASVLYLVTLSTLAADIILTGDVPTQREDGSPLPVSEISGYQIIYGDTPDGLNQTYTITTPDKVEATIEDFDPGTYYFAVATVDSDGIRGNFSEVISAVVPALPNAPSNINVTVIVTMEFNQ